MLFSDAALNVIQVDWQSLSVLGSLLGAALVTSAKVLAAQWDKSTATDAKRHEESRQDAREAREENRVLSQAILGIQRQTVETLSGVQHEIKLMVDRLDRLEGSAPKPPAR